MENNGAFSVVFQSTPPVWGATGGHELGGDRSTISIHAPRVGGDPPKATRKKVVTIFQSTPPVWGATDAQELHAEALHISIHAPRVGGDSPPVWSGN